jgi:hypothetical protein
MTRASRLWSRIVGGVEQSQKSSEHGRPSGSRAVIDPHAAARLSAVIRDGAFDEQVPEGAAGHAAMGFASAPSAIPRAVPATAVATLAIACLWASGRDFAEISRRSTHAATAGGSFGTSRAAAGPMFGAGRDPGTGDGDQAMSAKNRMRAAVVAAAAATGSALAQDAVQWRVEDGGNGHWYGLRTVQYTLSWKSFLSELAEMGSFAFCANSNAEAAWVSSNIVVDPTGDGALVGGVLVPIGDGTEQWIWADGQLIADIPWCQGAPNEPSVGERWLYMNDQAHAYPGAPAGCFDDCPWGGWSATNVPLAVVEWSADCNNDGIVDYGQCRDGTLADYDGNNIPDCCERGEPCVLGHYPVQWGVSEGGNGHWYRGSALASGGYSRASALAEARSLNGDLVCFSSQAERDFVTSNVLNDTRMWVQDGGTTYGPWTGAFLNSSCQWEWTSGEPFTYAPWAFGEPDSGCGWAGNNFGCLACKGCGQQPSLPTQLVDLGGNLPLAPGLIIEWSADCNNDGIVDYGQILQGQLADTNANGVPDSCESPTCADADLFPTGTVNGADLGAMLSQWGEAPAGTASDLNRDGAVDGTDLGILLSFWGPCEG